MSQRRDLSTYTDSPISRPEEDRLDRAEFAEHVARRIEAASGGPSVVFGLAGPWGGGKSSVLNMIQAGIEANDSVWKVQRFTPWAAFDQTTLVTEFYATISSAIPAKAKDKAKKAFASLLSIGAEGAALIPTAGGVASEVFKSAARYLEDVKPFDEQFRELSNQLRQAEARILVIVDDLDRLDADELLAVLKAVRLLGSFPGIHYLLSYDQSTISDVLSRTAVANGNKQRALDYLEKIVQYPFAIPPLQAVHRDREIEELLSTIAERNGIDISSTPGRTSLVWNFLNRIPDSELVTLRAIHRFISQFDVVLTSIGPNEVHFLDLLLLTFLRVEFPDLYESLRRWKSDLTAPRQQVVYMGRTDRPKIDWRKRLKLSLEHVDDSETQEKLFQMVRFLFPAVLDTDGNPGFGRSDADYRCVSESDYFDRYFNFTVPAGDISDAEVVAGLNVLAVLGRFNGNTSLEKSFSDSRRRIALKKARQLISRVGFTSQSAQSSAVWLTDSLGLALEQPRLWSLEMTLVADLLSIAISRAESDASAQEAVDIFSEHCGLPLAAMVVAANERTTDNPYVPERFDAALAGHRERQYQSCISDLQAEVTPDTGGILFHWSLMDETTRDRLRDYVKNFVSDWDDLASVGVRLLGEPTVRDGDELIGELYINILAELLPRTEWPVISADVDTSSPLNLGDLSYENKLKVVSQTLAQNL
ncbi:P-loop NTPase fold protein [Nocardia amikacinitolerans]|uniref:KAP family P-loop NTPase fold protein n=1 Tax=Nocardia amikacinitolerans TaxID=756689 RepID=UPI00367778DD